MNLVASAILRGATGPASYAEYYGASSWRGKARSNALETGGAAERGNGPSKANDPALSVLEALKGAARQRTASKP